jgi:hypothetical protein
MLPEHRMAEKSDVNNKPLKVCCELLGIDPCHVGQALYGSIMKMGRHS